MNNRKEISEAQANEMFPEVMDTIKDLDKMLDRVYPIAVKSLERYSGIEDLLYDCHEGYYIVYKIVTSMNDQIASVSVSDSLMKALNTTDAEVVSHAWHNLSEKIDKSATCKSMSTVLKKIIGSDDIDLPIPESDPQMYVLTIDNGSFQMSGLLGNYHLLRNTVFKIFPMADKVIILPSSVYEFILIPIVKSEESFISNTLTSMVQEVNGTQVDLNDQVADNAFLLTRSEIQYI